MDQLLIGFEQYTPGPPLKQRSQTPPFFVDCLRVTIEQLLNPVRQRPFGLLLQQEMIVIWHQAIGDDTGAVLFMGCFHLADVLPHSGVHVMNLAGKKKIGDNKTRAIIFSQISPQSKNKKPLSETLASYTPAPQDFSLWYQINLIEISSTSQRSSFTKKN